MIMEIKSLKTKQGLKECKIIELQKIRVNYELDRLDINYINNSILAKLRSSREILEFSAELNYYIKNKDDINFSRVITLFKQAAPFIKSMISQIEIKLILSRIETDFIRESVSKIIKDAIVVDPLVF
jgi:hypothetical protein